MRIIASPFYLFLLFSFTALIIFSSNTSAQFSQNLTIGNAKALSLGHAVTADPPGVDSIHYNPAGIYTSTDFGTTTEFFLVIAPEPDITLGSQWTGEYQDTNFNINDCDTACLLDNDASLEYQEGKVEDFQAYVPWYGPTDYTPVLPRGGFVYKQRRFAFGLSTYVTAASGYHIPDGNIGEFPIKTVVGTNAVLASPTLAFAISEKFTVGIAMPLNYSAFQTDFAIRTPNLLIALASESISQICNVPNLDQFCTDDGESLPLYDELILLSVEAEDQFTPSFNVGFLWQPTSWLSLGGVYQSEVKQEFEGEFTIQYDEAAVAIIESGITNIIPGAPESASDSTYIEKGSVSMSQIAPKHIALGVSMQVTPRIKFNIDYKKTYYSVFDEATFHFDRPTYLSIAAQVTTGVDRNTATTPLGFMDNDNFAFGLEYQWSDSLKLRLGYEDRPSVIPPENRTYATVLSDTYIYSGGFSYVVSDAWEIDFAAAKVTSQQNIPSGTSYVNTWDPEQIFAAYPGYHLKTDLTAYISSLGFRRKF